MKHPRGISLKKLILVLVLLFVAAGLGWGIYAVAWATSVKPGGRPIYVQKAVELVETKQLDRTAPNAWDAFKGACDVLAAERDAFRSSLPSEPTADWPKLAAWPWDWSASLQKDVPVMVSDQTALLARRLEATSLHAQLAKLPGEKRFVRPLQGGPLIGVLLPELGLTRELTRYQTYRYHNAAAKGDWKLAAALFEEMLTFARILGTQGFLIDRLVGYAILNAAFTEVTMNALERPLPPEAAREMLAAIDRQTGWLMAADPYEGERMATLDSIEWTHSDDGKGDGRFLPAAAGDFTFMTPGTGGGAIGGPAIGNVAGFFMPSKKESIEKLNEYYDNANRRSRMSRAERLADTWNPDVWVESLPKSYIMLRIMLPALGRSEQAIDSTRQRTDAVRILLALEIHRAERGEYPVSLQGLAPAYLPELPKDIYSPDGEWGYQRLQATGALGDAVKFYSFGGDGKNDGGTFLEKNPIEALHDRSKAGTDYNFLERRAPWKSE